MKPLLPTWYERRRSSNRTASSVGAIEAPAAGVPQRLTHDEQTAALVMLLVALVAGAPPPASLPDDDEHDLEAAVWRAVEDRRHEDDPERWLARVGYLRDGYRSSRARRARLAG